MKRRSFLALLGASPLAPPAALPIPTQHLTATAVRVFNETPLHQDKAFFESLTLVNFPPFPPGWLTREIPCRTTYTHAFLYGPTNLIYKGGVLVRVERQLEK